MSLGRRGITPLIKRRKSSGSLTSTGSTDEGMFHNFSRHLCIFADVTGGIDAVILNNLILLLGN